MPVYNVLLQITDLGWREQTATTVVENIRIEGMLGSGAIDNEAEAERIAAAELARYSTPVVSDSVTVDPVDANDTPFISHHEGQQVNLVGTGESDVESVAFTRDDVGLLTFAVELHGHVDTVEERVQRGAQKMTDGTFGGVSKVAQPTHPRFQADQFQPAVAQAEGGCGCFPDQYVGRFGNGTVSIPNGGGSTTSINSLLTNDDNNGLESVVVWNNTSKRFDVDLDMIVHVRLMALIPTATTGISEMFNAGINSTPDYYTAQLVNGGSVAELSIWYTRAVKAGDSIAGGMSLWQNSGAARNCTYAEVYVYAALLCECLPDPGEG